MAEVIQGGPEKTPIESNAGPASPASASDPGEKSPGASEVTIGGEKFVISESMAKALEAQSKDIKKQMQDLQKAFQESRQPKPTPQDPQQPVAKYNWETKLWEDPNSTLEEVKRQAKDEIMEEMRKEYRNYEIQKEGSKKFWDKFYSDNDDLKGAELIVEALAARETDLHEMPGDEGAKELAERVRGYLLKVRPPTKGEKPPVVEGAPQKAPKNEESAPKEEERAQSLGSVLKERARARAESRKLKVVN